MKSNAGEFNETDTERLATMEEIFGAPIHVVTREMLLADGTLVDVSDMARSYGITFPVAMSRAAFEDAAEWTDQDSANKGGTLGQSTGGRLMDVCCMLRHFIHNGRQEQLSNGTTRLPFTFYRIPRTGKGHLPRRVDMVAICGPDDDASPCITIFTATEPQD